VKKKEKTIEKKETGKNTKPFLDEVAFVGFYYIAILALCYWVAFGVLGFLYVGFRILTGAVELFTWLLLIYLGIVVCFMCAISWLFTEPKRIWEV